MPVCRSRISGMRRAFRFHIRYFPVHVFATDRSRKAAYEFAAYIGYLPRPSFISRIQRRFKIVSCPGGTYQFKTVVKCRSTGQIRITSMESTQAKNFDDLPDILTPRHLMKFLPIGRNAVYNLLKANRIPSVRVGQKFLVTKTALREFLGLPVE